LFVTSHSLVPGFGIFPLAKMPVVLPSDSASPTDSPETQPLISIQDSSSS